ncbi:hypothetical protein [Ornithinimicrobium cerasi]|uniref:Uncharacterized protein n=1 Tax=Ornithinimicrobium cerasi TaxID=2248773 RepID=A0A285VRQ6_9MICO|nr:hypothetical protein [Ornithinimicrobium cerasi]SOC55906.1 hypothetical protein SAMN05421879_106105 [Ornithinimicrobium cerasi]
MARCQECRRQVAGAGSTTVSGRRLCGECHGRLAAHAGAASSLAAGDGVGDALVTGMSTRAYAGAFTGEAGAARARAARLRATRGFWRRLWVRVVR